MHNSLAPGLCLMQQLWGLLVCKTTAAPNLFVFAHNSLVHVQPLCARQVPHNVEQDRQDLIKHQGHVLGCCPHVSARVVCARQEHVAQQHVAAALAHPVRRRQSGLLPCWGVLRPLAHALLPCCWWCRQCIWCSAGTRVWHTAAIRTVVIRLSCYGAVVWCCWQARRVVLQVVALLVVLMWQQDNRKWWSFGARLLCSPHGQTKLTFWCKGCRNSPQHKPLLCQVVGVCSGTGWCRVLCCWRAGAAGQGTTLATSSSKPPTLSPGTRLHT